MPESPDVEETSKNLPWKCDLADLVKVPDGLDGTFGSKRYRKQGERCSERTNINRSR